MGRCGFVCALLLVGGTASADESKSVPAPTNFDEPTTTPMAKPWCETMVERRWPSLPDDHSLSLEDQITDHLSELGNMIGGHMNVLSDHMVALHVDGRRNRARLRLGGGNPHYLNFQVDSDWLFADGKAQVKARLELGLMGHEMELKLPDMDVSHDNYHGQDLVQVNVSMFEKRF